MLCKIWKGTFNELALPVPSLKVLTNVELSDNKRTITPEELRSAGISQPDDFYNFFLSAPLRTLFVIHINKNI
jgi:hypothetical protein